MEEMEVKTMTVNEKTREIVWAEMKVDVEPKEPFNKQMKEVQWRLRRLAVLFFFCKYLFYELLINPKA